MYLLYIFFLPVSSAIISTSALLLIVVLPQNDKQGRCLDLLWHTKQMYSWKALLSASHYSIFKIFSKHFQALHSGFSINQDTFKSLNTLSSLDTLGFIFYIEKQKIIFWTYLFTTPDQMNMMPPHPSPSAECWVCVKLTSTVGTLPNTAMLPTQYVKWLMP